LREEFEIVLEMYTEKDNDMKRVGRVMDAFIFDHRFANGISPYDFFLLDAKIRPEDRMDYIDLKENRFGIFQVMDVKIGEGLLLNDLIREEDIFVNERMGSTQLTPGYLLFCRVARFRGTNIIIGPNPESWPPDAAYPFMRNIESIRKELLREGFDGFTPLRTGDFIPPQSLDEVKRELKRKLDEVGLKIDFRGLERRINENIDPRDAFPEIFSHLYPTKEDFTEIMDLVHDLWNKSPRKEFGGKSPDEMSEIGPLETMIVKELTEESMNVIDPDRYKSVEEANEAYKVFRDRWLNTPQKELNGKTPMEEIEEEREKLGVKRDGFPYSIKITKQEVSYRE
jgi:hypothetical protein